MWVAPESRSMVSRIVPQYSNPNIAEESVLMRGARRPAPSAERRANEHSANVMPILPPDKKLYNGKAMQPTVTRLATHFGAIGLPSFLSTAVTKPKYSNAAWYTKNSMKARYRTPP